jgi:hypothetical protein
MTFGYQMEKDTQSKTTTRQRRMGIRIAITGSLASILLWFSVSIIGRPISSANGFSSVYIAALSAPAILIAVLAIRESKTQL